MRVVLDANVIVSAARTFEVPTSTLAKVLRAGIRNQYELIISDHIIGEVESALSKPFFVAHLAPETGRQILKDLEEKAANVLLTRQVYGVATHWQDDLVLATALSGEADYLVTGDKELLAVQHSFAFRIIHPNEFLVILNGDTGGE